MALTAKLLTILLLIVPVLAQDAPVAPEKPTLPTAESPGTPAEVGPPAKPEVAEAPQEPPDTDWGETRMRRNRTGMSRTVFGEHITIGPGESIHDLVLIGGSADIQGEVERKVVAVGGSVKVSGSVGGSVVIVGGKGTFSGHVDGDTVVVLGSAEVADTAKLDRSTVFIGGPFSVSSDATIGGERFTLPLGDFLPQIEFLKSYFVRGPLLGRWLTFHTVWPWLVAATFTLVYLATLLVFPGAGRAVYLALEERPVTSIFSGLLTLIFFGPLAFLLVISVAGILVIPFLKIALILALLFGKVGVICFIGRGLGKTTGATAIQAPLFAFFAGAIILTLTYAIPLFGIFAWAMATVFGLGGAIVALANTFKREEAMVQPAAVLVSTLRNDRGSPAPAATGSVPPAPSPVGEPPPLANATSQPPTVTDLSNLRPQDAVLLPRAGFWKRFLATILDLLLVGAIILILPVIGPALFIPTAVIYFVGMWTWKGTTVGGLVLGQKIVRTDGRKVTLGVAVVRSLMSLFSMLVVFLGFLWAGWDREKQTWHDKIAGTVVVKMPKGFALI